MLVPPAGGVTLHLSPGCDTSDFVSVSFCKITEIVKKQYRTLDNAAIRQKMVQQYGCVARELPAKLEIASLGNPVHPTLSNLG